MKICPTCGRPEETRGPGLYYLATRLKDAKAELARREKRCHSISGIAVIVSVILLIGAVVAAVVTGGVVAAAMVIPVIVLGAVLGAALVYYSQTSRGTAQDEDKSYTEVMVILEELRAWIERNRESKEEVQEDLERLMRQLQEGLENILNILDSIFRRMSNE